jgi:hypothetical protein
MNNINEFATFTFTHNTMNVKAVYGLRGKAEHMMLQSEAKNNFGVVTVTVHCETPHERRILEDLAKSYK